MTGVLAVARIMFGRHARLGLSVRASGDRWWECERDPGDYIGKHRAPGPLFETMCHGFEGPPRCTHLGRGFCPANVDGFCDGGRIDGRCHG